MSNRLLGILIMLSFIGSFYIYYNLFYIPEIKAKELELIEKQRKIEEEKLIKKIDLVKQEKEIYNFTSSEKIEDIKENSKNYKTFTFDNNIKVYFKKGDVGLDLYYNYYKIGSFNLYSPEYLKVQKILGNKGYLYIEVGNNKYYYNSETKIIKQIKLKVDVLYVKEGLNNELIFVTNKGSFIYTPLNDILEYFSYFNDYINFNNGYIGIVQFDDIQKLKNLGFESSNKNLIIYYNPHTKEKKILFKTVLDYNKLYIKNNKLYIETEDNELYELENI